MSDAPVGGRYDGQFDEVKDLIEETLELAKENNKMLKSIRRDALLGGLAKFVIWILLALASLYFVQQYLGPLMSPTPGSGTATTSYQGFIDQYKSLLGQ